MRTAKTRRTTVALGLVLGLVVSTGAALGHEERETSFPDGSGSVPAYRPLIATPNLVVCTADSKKRIKKIGDRKLRKVNRRLLKKCEFDSIQDAVNAVTKRGTTIYLLPGVYREERYRGRPACADQFEDTILTYEQQKTCPQAQNLIGIFGDSNPKDDKRVCDSAVCDLQIEGTGSRPEDVRITGGFDDAGEWAKLNGIRGDRADGLYLRNFTVELFEFNAIYVLETDGFVMNEMVVRYSDEYGILAFAVDHGVIKNCDGYNTGDAPIYPGSASDVNSDKEAYSQKKRWAVEIFNCKSHHSALGYSGTAGNSVYAHDNEFYENQSGIVTDSVFPGHPGLPQDHSWFADNKIYSNNNNYTEKYVQSGICDKKPAKRGYQPAPGKPKTSGTVCTAPPAPVGAGLVIAGGNWNLVENNQIWDNWRAGVMLFSVPAPIREEYDPTKAWDTSHSNMFSDNAMSLTPADKIDLNGVDFWWDDQGEGNCWAGNKSGAGEEVTSNTMYPGGLPDCESGGSAGLPNNPYKSGQLAPCALYDREDETFRDPPACDFFDTPEEPES